MTVDSTASRRFGSWLNQLCDGLDVKSGSQLHRLLVRAGADLSELTVTRWFQGRNYPRGAHLGVLMAALASEFGDRVYDDFESFLRREAEATVSHLRRRNGRDQMSYLGRNSQKVA